MKVKVGDKIRIIRMAGEPEEAGKELHEPYNDGTIHYAENGNAICPICGKEFRKLGGHLRYFHKCSAAETYRLCGINPRRARASNVEYRVHMKKVQDPKTITVNLVAKGWATRIKPGEKFRTERRTAYGN